jgi:hypothetical protein
MNTRWVACLCITVAAVGLAAVAIRASPVAATLSVSGVIQDGEGRAIPGAGLVRDGYKDRTGGTPWWTTDAAGRFRIDGLPAGPVTLKVFPGDRSLFAPNGRVVETTAGTKDLVIVVDPGPQIFVKISDYQSPAGDPRYARLIWFESDGRRPTRYAPIRSDGWTRFVGLPADGTFELWTWAAKNRPVRVAGLRPGDQEHAVAPTEGRTIRGKVLVDPADARRGVGVGAEAYPGFDVASAKVAADGTFEIQGLPEGIYRVQARIQGNPIEMPVGKELRTGVSDAVFDLRR